MMKIDKINGNVAFNDEVHRYWNVNDNSINYISVTTMIEKYEQPYDKEFWSSYKALEKILDSESWKIEKKSLLTTKKFDKKILEVYNISINEFNKVQQNILDEWAKKNRESCERGTKIHSIMENKMYSTENNISLKKFGIGGKFQCKKDYSDLNLEYGIYPEYLIYYDNDKLDLHVAGQIDLLVKYGNDIVLGDYKTNEKLDFKSFYDYNKKSSVRMKYPLTSLDDCNFNHYQMQLSTYAWMLQKINPEFNIQRLFIYHFAHDGSQALHEVNYLKDEVEKMLKHYAKEQKLIKQKAKYERIEY